MKNIFPCEYEDYLLLDRCGSGGMAEVFRAITRDPVSRLVVIKKSHSMIQRDPQIRSMFLDEIKVSARMNHPNIVHLNSYGNSGEYIELEYVYGKTINEIWSELNERGEKIPLSVALFVAHEVAKGLYYAHNMKDKLTGESLNIIHRDISPHNIMLSFSSEVKILDFGIAKVANNLSHTGHGVLKGKPFYMSPEQANASESIDCRTDIFSLGVVLWNMVANQKLFAAHSSAEYLKKLKEFEIKDPREFNPECSENLSRIILKALEHNPQDRYPNIDEFREEVYQESTRLCEGHSVVPVVKTWIESQFTTEIDKEKEKLQNLLSQAKIYMNGVTDEDTEFVISDSVPVGALPGAGGNKARATSLKSSSWRWAAMALLVGLFVAQSIWMGYSQWYQTSKVRTMSQVQVLISQENWQEALQTLKTVDPQKRNQQWEEALVEVTVALVKWRNQGEIKADTIQRLDDTIYSFNQLKKYPEFIKARSQWVEKAMQACLQSGSTNCIDHLFQLIGRAPVGVESLLSMADQITYHYLPRYALSVYAEAHRSDFDSSFCKSRRQKLAVQNMLASIEMMPEGLQKDFQTVAMGECVDRYQSMIQKTLAKMSNPPESKLCQMLKGTRFPAQVMNYCSASQ